MPAFSGARPKTFPQKKKGALLCDKEQRTFFFAMAAPAVGPLPSRRRRHGRPPGLVLVQRFLAPLASQLRLFLAPRDRDYGPVKAAMLADGHYGVAAGLATAAVLANHVRRVLAPWLGQFLWWWHPLQGMKLARATPHYFVAEQLLRSAATDGGLGFWVLQTCALAATRALLRHRLLLVAADATATTTTTTCSAVSRGSKGNNDESGGGASGGGGGGGGGTGSRAAAKRTTASSSSCLIDCCRVIYLCLCLMQVEYAYAEACWAVSWLYALTQLLLRGTAAERRFVTHRLLTGDSSSSSCHNLAGADSATHWRGLLLTTGLLLWWAWRAALRPVRRHGVVGVALSALPVLGGLLAVSTAHVVRYSNKYFIWLEMSEMLLTWVWLVLGGVVVAAWRLCDEQDSK